MEQLKDNRLDQLKDPELSKQCYHTPEGYFEGLSERIMSQIPETTHEAYVIPSVSLWQKVKPALYLVASFVMVYLGLEVTQLLSPAEVNAPVAMTQEANEVEIPQMISDSEYARFYQEYSQRIASKDDERALSGLDNKI